VEEKTDAGTFAYQLSEHVADRVGDGHAEAYLAEVVGELMLLCPGVKDRFSEKLLGELKEEIARREDPKYAHATITLIETIEDEWRNRE
jgi:hypothetical protein